MGLEEIAVPRLNLTGWRPWHFQQWTFGLRSWV